MFILIISIGSPKNIDYKCIVCLFQRTILRHVPCSHLTFYIAHYFNLHDLEND
jgi:hypothetical protein